MTKTIVTILALGHSGSHYSSLLLGSHSKATHIGEARYLGKPEQMERKEKTCFLCNGIDACPVFHGITAENLHNLYDIVFSRIDASKTMLVDTSKNMKWIESFVGNDRFNMKYVHLVRDPRALIRRWSLTYTGAKERFHIRWKTMRGFPRRAAPLLFGSQSDVYLYNWLMRNQQITRFIRRHRLDAYVVTYLDLARDAASELKKLMDWLGVVYEPSQLEYWNVKHHGTQKADYEWVKQGKSPYIDLRWKTDLPSATIARVAENPDVNAYLKELGLAFTDDGVIRVQPRSAA